MQTATAIRVALTAPSMRLPGGHAVQAARLVDAWRDDPNVSVRLIPINPAPRLLSPALRVKYLRTAVTQLCYWRSLIREFRHADVVHVFSPSNSSFFRSTFPAIVVAKVQNKRVVVNYRGDGREHLARSRRARRLLRSVDLIVVPSVYFERIFAEFAMRAQIVPNIADLSRFRYRVRNPLRPRLISTRNFAPIYNVACTLRAFARVRDVHPDATLTLAGAGPEQAALRRLVAEMRLSGVTFAGSVSQAALGRLYDESDIYVQTPLVDNMPGSLIEAFASGLPAVATRVGGVPALLEHGVHGLLARSNDDEDVARQVLHILADPAAARDRAAAAFRTCDAYATDVVREQWRRVYHALMSDRAVASDLAKQTMSAS